MNLDRKTGERYLARGVCDSITRAMTGHRMSPPTRVPMPPWVALLAAIGISLLVLALAVAAR